VNTEDIVNKEFCEYCGAGIGEHRREGEGTCIRCNPEGRASEHNVLNDKCPVKRRILVESSERSTDLRNEPFTIRREYLTVAKIRAFVAWLKAPHAAGETFEL
jgi:hypothetical protein